MKSYQNPRNQIPTRNTCWDELLSNPRFGQATNHAIVWKFLQEFIVPYQKSKVPYLGLLDLLSFFLSSLLLLFLFLFLFFSTVLSLLEIKFGLLLSMFVKAMLGLYIFKHFSPIYLLFALKPFHFSLISIPTFSICL